MQTVLESRFVYLLCILFVISFIIISLLCLFGKLPPYLPIILGLLWWTVFLFFIRCTNCGLSLIFGKRTFEDREVHNLRRFPSRYCGRCGQDHWHPYDPPNDDWKEKGFDVDAAIKANKAARKLKKANKK